MLNLFSLIGQCWWKWHKRWRGWFNIKMPPCQYRKSNYGDKTVLWPSYLHNGISYTWKMTSLYWPRAMLECLRSVKKIPWSVIRHWSTLSLLMSWCPGPWFSKKMLSYQYRKSHCGDKTVIKSSYLHSGNLYLSIAIFSPYILLAGLLLQSVAMFQSRELVK